jgi:Polyketide cyclase / dehydrase and lipid transport
MRSTLALLFGRSDRPIDRATYLKAGISLMLLKYAVDAVLIGVFGGVIWTPVDYLLPMISFNAEKIAGFPLALNIALLVWALPFIWIGVSLSVRRAIDAGIFPGVVVTFFLPFLNYLLMTALVLAPSRARRPAAQPAPEPEAEPSRGIGRSGGLGVLAGALTGLLAAGVGVVLLNTYGASIFLGTPFLIGLVSGFVANRIEDKTRGETIGVGQLALLAAGGTMILLAFEGIICLMMALPIASPLAMLGSFVGHLLAERRRPSSLSHLTILFGLVSLGSVIDAAMPVPGGRVVMTAIEIDAPAEAVWEHVTSFSDITAPPRWYFRTGLAYPLRARLEGSGAGAVRHCEFTTGAFVEPITVWDVPRRLAFDVIAQPPPLQEWSPYTRIYAPHLDGFFRTSRGEFRLVALDGGRTRLEGRTWYALDMQPAMYWTAIADTILHAIHGRVLEHIKSEAERRS